MATTTARADRQHVLIMAARTGEVVRRVEAADPFPLAWESGSSLVFGSVDDGLRSALVRCKVDGGCELATEPVDARSTDAGGGYFLGSG